MSPMRSNRHLEQVHLKAGEVLMSDEELVVTTVLGPCVSVCMFDPVFRRGAICHGALPNAPISLNGNPFRYCDESVHYLIERFRRTGTPPSRLVVKVFGGADILATSGRKGYQSIGKQNTMATLEALGWQKIRPTVVETGGDRGRRLVFLTHTGESYVKKVASMRAAGA